MSDNKLFNQCSNVLLIVMDYAYQLLRVFH